MKTKLEELGIISEAEFEKRMRGIKINSIMGITFGCILFTLGIVCFLYAIRMAQGFDPLGIIDASSSTILVLVMLKAIIFLLMYLGMILYCVGRSGFDRITEYRFMRQVLKNLHNKSIEGTS